MVAFVVIRSWEHFSVKCLAIKPISQHMGESLPFRFLSSEEDTNSSKIEEWLSDLAKVIQCISGQVRAGSQFFRLLAQCSL